MKWKRLAVNIMEWNWKMIWFCPYVCYVDLARSWGKKTWPAGRSMGQISCQLSCQLNFNAHIIELWSIEWFLMLSSFDRSSLIFFPPLGSFDIPRRPKFHPFKPVTPSDTHDEVVQFGSLDKILWFVHSTGWKLLDSTLPCLFWFFGILQIHAFIDFGIYLKSWYWTLLGLSGKY